MAAMRRSGLGCSEGALTAAALAGLVFGAALLGCATPPSEKLRVPNTGAEVPPEVTYWRGNFKASDGLELYEQGWRPSERARAVFVFLHGLKDHSSRYRDLGIQLAHRGIAVYVIDMRGHGYSEGVRGHIDSLENALADFDLLIGRAKDRHAGAPLFVGGQGFGADLAALWAAHNAPPPPPDPNVPSDANRPPSPKPLLTGLVLVAPVLRGEVKGGERLGTRAAATFAPQVHSLELNLADWSSDPAAVADLKSDPLIYEGQPTASTARELLRASDDLQATSGRLTMPVLILFGGADTVASLEVAKAFHEKLGATDKTIQVYDGLRHDLFHERERKQVTAEMLTWLNTHANLPPEPVAEAAPAPSAAAKTANKKPAKTSKKPAK
jgi:alpha-beta hydrolase superfamily lysophospholipase